MALTQPETLLSDLVRQLDAAVEAGTDEDRCEQVKNVLHDVVAEGRQFVPEALLQPAEGCYARRLLHKDPEGRYTILVMVWAEGQGTAIHDHAGMWCVECVYQGRIKVVSYSHEETGNLHQFTREKEIFAGISDAGALIPPFDHHTIQNVDPENAVTIHVYGGELTWCHAFMPVEGGYERVRRELCYSD